MDEYTSTIFLSDYLDAAQTTANNTHRAILVGPKEIDIGSAVNVRK